MKNRITLIEKKQISILSMLIAAIITVLALQAVSKESAAGALNQKDLMLHVDFEQEQIKSKRGHDVLITKLPSGEPAGIGIQYEGGNDRARFAKIITDPTDKNNKVLHYWLKHATVEGQRKGRYKGRVQLNFPDVNKKEIYQRFRMYLHPDLDLYRSYPRENTWFVFSEFWMGAKWKKHPYPFKITFNMSKPEGPGKPLYFVVTGDIGAGGKPGKGVWQTVWSEGNLQYEIPVGQWLDVEIGYRQGDKNTGRLYMSVKAEKDAGKTTIFDITNWTYHPDAGKPVPLTHWSPLKIYTSADIIDHIRTNGGVAQILWDDFEIYSSWPDSVHAAESGQ